MLTVLIVEDERVMAELVAYTARLLWPDAQLIVAEDGAEALRRFTATPADLVVLDVSMPPPDGLEVCRRLRALSRVPILMLTARDGILDKVRGLDLGADDYLTKPFNPLELLARMRALQRRAVATVEVPKASVSVGPQLQVGEVALDGLSHEVRVRGEVIRVTRTEYRLLELLMRHAGTVLPHQYLLEQAWGPAYGADRRPLKVVVERLRRKLGDDTAQARYIATVRGRGYRFVPAP
jgi:DNA-binding response OmpR family regulator